MVTKRAPQSSVPGASRALAELLGVLDLAPSGPDRFEGHNIAGGRKRIYGGQVLAQAVIAASRTVEAARQLHSLHGYFLVGGAPDRPVTYQVERLRDGGSFTTRRVTAEQNGAPIFAMSGSFHGEETGLSHGAPMPEAPDPDTVPTLAALMKRADIAMPEPMRAFYQREAPMDLRYVDIGRFTGAPERDPRQRIWIKARAELPADPSLHMALLAYASDFALVETALLPHGRLIFGGDMQLASLDHALWFHRPFRMDDWLLYVLDSPVAGGGRGFSRGAFFTRGGDIVASVTQEMLMRPAKGPAKTEN